MLRFQIGPSLQHQVSCRNQRGSLKSHSIDIMQVTKCRGPPDRQIRATFYPHLRFRLSQRTYFVRSKTPAPLFRPLGPGTGEGAVFAGETPALHIAHALARAGGRRMPNRQRPHYKPSCACSSSPSQSPSSSDAVSIPIAITMTMRMTMRMQGLRKACPSPTKGSAIGIRSGVPGRRSHTDRRNLPLRPVSPLFPQSQGMRWQRFSALGVGQTWRWIRILAINCTDMDLGLTFSIPIR